MANHNPAAWPPAPNSVAQTPARTSAGRAGVVSLIFSSLAALALLIAVPFSVQTMPDSGGYSVSFVPAFGKLGLDFYLAVFVSSLIGAAAGIVGWRTANGKAGMVISLAALAVAGLAVLWLLLGDTASVLITPAGTG